MFTQNKTFKRYTQHKESKSHLNPTIQENYYKHYGVCYLYISLTVALTLVVIYITLIYLLNNTYIVEFIILLYSKMYISLS